MDDAIPTTDAARLVLLKNHVDESSRAIRHPLEHYDPARGKRILKFVGQELQLCLDTREPSKPGRAQILRRADGKNPRSRRER